MAWRQHLEFAPVEFVKEKEIEKSNRQPGDSSGAQQSQTLNLAGQDVRSFYEDLVGLNGEPSKNNFAGSPHCNTNREGKAEKKGVKHFSRRKTDMSSSKTCSPAKLSKSARSAKSTSKPEVSISTNAFLAAAQNGEESVMRTVLEAGSIDVDTSDDFGWTALMCAVAGNHETVVRLLLTHGADPWLKDKRGMNSVDIAKKRRRHALVGILENFLLYRGAGTHGTTACDSEEWKVKVKMEPYFCSVCNAKFSTSEESHIASTLHLFNMRLTPQQTDYQIPVSNVGYRMMLRSGWNQESGLGVKGQGQKFPVKTKLKRDRKGLGGKSHLKAKVTHFNSNDLKAVKHVNIPSTCTRTERPVTVSKKMRTAKERQDQKMEMKFRRDFYS